MASTSCRAGRGNIEHNNRQKSHCRGNKDINWDKSEKNITFVKKDVYETFKELFEPAIEEYNQRQLREDRKKTIEGYYESVCKNQRPYEEMIIALTDKGDYISEQEYEKIYREYLEKFQRYYTNLVVINATVHMDEKGSPHMHLDYIPVADGYKQGLSKRYSISKSLENLGFKPEKATRKNNAMMHFHKEQKQIFNDIVMDNGIPVHAVGTHDYLTPQEYKDETMRKNAELQNKNCLLKREIADLSRQKEKLDILIHEAKDELKTANTSLENIKKREKDALTACQTTEKMTLKLMQDVQALSGLRNELADILNQKSRELGMAWKRTTDGYIQDLKDGVVEMSRRFNYVHEQQKKHSDRGDR